MNKLTFLFLLSLCILGCRDENKAQSFEQMADRIEDHYVSDRRTDRFEIEHKSGFQGLYLRGYTTIPAAFDSLRAALATGFVIARNEVRLLPDAELLEGKTTGIINVSVANLRSEPGHSQELATQALMGTPIEVLDFQDGWYLVRTPDRYLAWLEPGAFVAMRPGAAQAWLKADKWVFNAKASEITASPDGGNILSDIVAGGMVRQTGVTEGDYTQVRLPDGKLGWVYSGYLKSPQSWWGIRRLSADGLLAMAEYLSGRPYLWGGTSAKGMDCSGFTKMAYHLNGYVIPRDASQQVLAGKEIELTADFANLEAGDLLFFGRFRQDGSEKYTHVGFYTGNGRFLHAGADNGRITEQSLRPGDEDFAEHRLKSLLRARRLAAGDEGVVPLQEAFVALLEPPNRPIE